MELNNTPVYIGTSGYNYDEWKGTFAPKDLDNYDLLKNYTVCLLLKKLQEYVTGLVII